MKCGQEQCNNEVFNKRKKYCSSYCRYKQARNYTFYKTKKIQSEPKLQKLLKREKELGEYLELSAKNIIKQKELADLQLEVIIHKEINSLWNID